MVVRDRENDHAGHDAMDKSEAHKSPAQTLRTRAKMAAGFDGGERNDFFRD